MLNLHLLEYTLKGYDHISDLLLAKYWVITGCKYSGCTLLKELHIHWAQIDDVQINNLAFGVVNEINMEMCTLYIPPGTRWIYRHHPVFGKFKNIVIEKQAKVWHQFLTPVRLSKSKTKS